MDFVYNSRGTRISLKGLTVLGKGAAGTAYELRNSKLYNCNVTIKVYHTPKIAQSYEKRIKYQITHAPSKINGDGFIIAWPIDYITDLDNNFIGTVLPLSFDNSIKLQYFVVPQLSKSLGSIWHEKFDGANGDFASLNRMKIIKNICIPYYYLHSSGRYVLRDIKPDNILVTPSGQITVVDMDSVQIIENNRLLFPAPQVTPGYAPMECAQYSNPNDIIKVSWDLFSIPVMFYQILFGIHPFLVTPKYKTKEYWMVEDSINSGLFPFGRNWSKIEKYPPLHNKFKQLPQNIQQLFILAFDNNVNSRPPMEKWAQEIHKYVIEKSKEIKTSDYKKDTQKNYYTPPTPDTNIQQQTKTQNKKTDTKEGNSEKKWTWLELLFGLPLVIPFATIGFVFTGIIKVLKMVFSLVGFIIRKINSFINNR